MKPNPDKIDDAVLALLLLTSFTEGKGEFAVTRAWKGHDWDSLDRLHQKGSHRRPEKQEQVGRVYGCGTKARGRIVPPVVL